MSTAHDPYLIMTIHFIDTEWCLKTFCLETTLLCDDHTSSDIKDAVIEIGIYVCLEENAEITIDS